MESGRVSKKGIIWASVGKVEIQASIGKVESGRVPENGPCEYRERVEFRRLPKMWNPGKYSKG